MFYLPNQVGVLYKIPVFVLIYVVVRMLVVVRGQGFIAPARRRRAFLFQNCLVGAVLLLGIRSIEPVVPDNIIVAVAVFWHWRWPLIISRPSPVSVIRRSWF